MKSIHNFLRGTVFALLLLVMVGCSGESNDQQGAVSGDSPVIAEMQENYEKLNTENEKLRAELEIVLTKLEIAELKIENLTKEMSEITKKLQATEQQIANFEKQLAATKDNTTETSQDKSSLSGTTSNSNENSSTPQKNGQSLSGNWFLQGMKIDGQFSWSMRMLFLDEGTGVWYQTYYVPKEDVPSIEEMLSHGIGLDNFDESYKFTWSLTGDKLHIVFEDGVVWDFKYSAEQQTMVQQNVEQNPYHFGREKTSLLEDYVGRSNFWIDREAKEAARMSKILGLWYFDVLTWTFNEDKTGIINIPEIGDQPATAREFTFELPYYGDNDPNPVIIIDWGNGNTSIYSIIFEADGSMKLKTPVDPEPLKFTRSFDASNCPFSAAIIESGMSVISGSMFSKFFP